MNSEKPSKKSKISRDELIKELRKDSYQGKWGLPEKERIEVLEKILKKEIFGDLMDKMDQIKIKSLIKELKFPGSSPNSQIRKSVEEIRKKYGIEKTRKIAKSLEELLKF